MARPERGSQRYCSRQLRRPRRRGPRTSPSQARTSPPAAASPRRRCSTVSAAGRQRVPGARLEQRARRAHRASPSWCTTRMRPPAAAGGTGCVYNIPAATTSLPAGAGDTQKNLLPAGAVQGRTDFGTAGYGGPCPPPGKPHHYYFRLYALKVPKLDLPADATRGFDRLQRARPGAGQRRAHGPLWPLAAAASGGRPYGRGW